MHVTRFQSFWVSQKKGSSLLSSMSLVNLTTVRECLKAIIPGTYDEYKFFSHLFLNEKLRGWLNYISMDHRQTSVQDQTAMKDVRTRQKRSNYYWRVHCQWEARQYKQTMWCSGWQNRVQTHQVTLLTEAQRRDPDTLMKKFKDWTKPKSNELQTETDFWHLKQKNSPLQISLTMQLP